MNTTPVTGFKSLTTCTPSCTQTLTVCRFAHHRKENTNNKHAGLQRKDLGLALNSRRALRSSPVSTAAATSHGSPVRQLTQEEKPGNVCLYPTSESQPPSHQRHQRFAGRKQQSLTLRPGPSFALCSVTFSKHQPALPRRRISRPALTSLSCLVCQAGQKPPLSVGWPRGKTHPKGFRFCLAQRSQAQPQHLRQLGLAENTPHYSFTLGHPPTERFAFLIGSMF